MRRIAVAARILAVCSIFAIPASANTIIVINPDNSTSPLDGSSFTAGTTYYAAFQLTGGDASDSSDSLTGFDIGGRSAVAPSAVDPAGCGLHEAVLLSACVDARPTPNYRSGRLSSDT